MSTSKGLFISFEGIDGCGKSTQIKMLCSYLKDRNKEFLMVREPGGTDISEQIRKILLHRHDQEISDRTEALLMTGSRAQLIDEKILPFLNKGKIEEIDETDSIANINNQNIRAFETVDATLQQSVDLTA